VIGHDDFAKLRLSDFIDPALIDEFDNWKFLGRSWFGEVYGFTQWLRPHSAPNELGALSLDLATLPEAVSLACLGELVIPLAPGMKLANVKAAIGTPIEQKKYRDDCTSYQFRTRGRQRYDIVCTILDGGPMTFIEIARTGLGLVTVRKSLF